MNLHFGYRPGCIGRIAELHATYYAKASGFGVPFEAKVARELAAFCLRFDPERDGLWLALDGDTIHASIVIDASHHETDGAHLRWFIASDAMRGRGVGNRLLRCAVDFCRAKAYHSIYLWTFDQLHAARHLYEKFGFVLASEQHASTWGIVVNEQKFIVHGLRADDHARDDR